MKFGFNFLTKNILFVKITELDFLMFSLAMKKNMEFWKKSIIQF